MNEQIFEAVVTTLSPAGTVHVAPMGVRYVVVPSTQGQGGGAPTSVPVAVRRTMSQQLDLAQLRSGAGLVLYENLAYVPIAAAVPGRVPVDSPRPAGPGR